MEHIISWQLAGHLASVLTMVAYLLKDILWLRFLTVLSCFAGILFCYFVPATPLWTVIYWNVIFAAINVVQIAIIVKERSGVRFSEEEKELHETLFKNFAPFEFMKLMRVGNWLTAKPGQILAVEKQPLDSVMLIYNGLAGTVACHRCHGIDDILCQCGFWRCRGCSGCDGDQRKSDYPQDLVHHGLFHFDSSHKIPKRQAAASKPVENTAHPCIRLDSNRSPPARAL